MLLSDEELEAAYLEGVRVCAETTDDDGSGWDIAGLRAVEVAVLARASKPVQVEVTDPEARPWVATDGDTRCQECGSRNPVWWTQHDIWNALMPDDGVLCPTCFHRAWLASAALGGGDHAAE